jgi:hypothetical protein
VPRHLHTDELTYSVTYPRRSPGRRRDVVTIYRPDQRRAAGRLEALGLSAQADKRTERVAEAAKARVLRGAVRLRDHGDCAS